jgi:uncharacterized protein (DUF4415 family)
MRKESDIAGLKGHKNPHAKRLKKQITIRIGIDVLEYFKALVEETGIPYQNLINHYLSDCVTAGRKPSLKWG